MKTCVAALIGGILVLCVACHVHDDDCVHEPAAAAGCDNSACKCDPCTCEDCECDGSNCKCDGCAPADTRSDVEKELDIISLRQAQGMTLVAMPQQLGLLGGVATYEDEDNAPATIEGAPAGPSWDDTPAPEPIPEPAVEPAPASEPALSAVMGLTTDMAELRADRDALRQELETLSKRVLEVKGFDPGAVERVANTLWNDHKSSLELRVDGLASRVSAVEASMLDREDVVKILEEELPRLLARVNVGGKNVSVPVRELGADNVITTVPGYAGTFSVPRGGTITSIAGIPTNTDSKAIQMGVYPPQNSQTVSCADGVCQTAEAGPYQLMAYPTSTGTVVHAFAQPAVPTTYQSAPQMTYSSSRTTVRSGLFGWRRATVGRAMSTCSGGNCN